MDHAAFRYEDNIALPCGGTLLFTPGYPGDLPEFHFIVRFLESLRVAHQLEWADLPLIFVGEHRYTPTAVLQMVIGAVGFEEPAGITFLWHHRWILQDIITATSVYATDPISEYGEFPASALTEYLRAFAETYLPDPATAC